MVEVDAVLARRVKASERGSSDQALLLFAYSPRAFAPYASLRTEPANAICLDSARTRFGGAGSRVILGRKRRMGRAGKPLGPFTQENLVRLARASRLQRKVEPTLRDGGAGSCHPSQRDRFRPGECWLAQASKSLVCRSWRRWCQFRRHNCRRCCRRRSILLRRFRL